MLISIQPIGTEYLLLKVLMIDRATVHLVNSTWWDGLQVAPKLWACNFFLKITVVRPNIYLCACKKVWLRKGYVTQGCFEWCSLTVQNLLIVLKEHNQVGRSHWFSFGVQNQRFRTFAATNLDHVYKTLSRAWCTVNRPWVGWKFQWLWI